MREQLDIYKFLRLYADSRSSAGVSCRTSSGSEALHYYNHLTALEISEETKQDVLWLVIRMGGLTTDPLDLISLTNTLDGNPKDITMHDAPLDELFDPTEASIMPNDWVMEEPTPRGSASVTSRILASRILGMTYEEMMEFVEEAPGNTSVHTWLSWAKERV